MKKIAIVLGVVAGIGLIGPKFVGDIVKSEYQETLDKLAQHPSFDITETQFTRTWFSGVSTVKVKLKGDLDQFENFEITVTDNISFGPIIVEDGVSFSLAKATSHFSFDDGVVSDEVANVLNDKLTVNSEFTYGMNSIVNVHLKEIIKEQDGNSIKIGEMTAQMTVADEKEIKGVIDWQGMNFNGPQSTIFISGAKMDFDQEVVSGDLFSPTAIMTGGGNFTMPEVVAKTPDGKEMFALNDLSISARSKFVNELIEMTLNYNVKEIKGQGQNFTNANLNVIFKNLDAEVLAELNGLLAQVSATASQEETAMQMQKVMGIATKLLAHNPEIEISDFSVETPEGIIKSDMLMSVDNTIYDPANPMSMMAALKADAKGNAPQLFFEKLGMKPMLDMYVDQGLIVRDNNDLSFNVQFSQGKLTVNGNVLPL